MKTYVTESLGPKQATTPEGYLLCSDVPVARTGIMVYGPYELQDERGELLDPGKDGVIYVSRDADAIFNKKTMSSFEGKPITVRHPATVGQLVNSGNWRDVASGVSQNVRRGTGDQSDLLLSDLLVTSKDAIDLVRSKRLREVSLGYIASYEQTRPGHARQTNILGNHIAFVEQGRCGSVCSIGDSKMNVVVDPRKEALRKAFNTRDAALFARALDDDWDGDSDDKKPLPDKYDDAEPNKTQTPSGFEGGNGGGKPAQKEAGNGSGSATHHVTVNVHGVGGGSPTATMDPSDQSTGSGPNGGATQEGVDPNNPDVPGGDPGAGDDPVEMIMGAIKKVDARLTALEQMVQGGGQPQQAPPKAQGGFPPKTQRTQDQTPEEEDVMGGGSGAGASASEIGEEEERKASTSDDESLKGPSGAPGPELEKNMVVKGSSEGGDGGAQQENKNAPELRKEPGSEGDKSGQDPLPKKVTGDQMYVPTQMEATRQREKWTDTLSRAELLMPGVRLPTFDAKFDEKQVDATLCTFKRRTLAASFETDRGNQAIRGFVTTDAPNFTGMTCDAVDVLFAAASERMSERNNVLNTRRGPAIIPAAAGNAPPPRTPAEINAFNRQFWEAKDRGL